jgi:hypothetical protein
MRKMLVLLSAVAVCLSSQTGHACGGPMSFRAYLDSPMWQPFVKYENAILKSRPQGQEQGAGASRDKTFVPLAGFSKEPATDALLRVRRAYADKSYEQARRELAEAGKAGLAGKELEELRLIDAKIDMRLADREDSIDDDLLKASLLKFQTFLETSQATSFRSEARGWIAHIHYLLREYPAAVKIYLDELERTGSIFSRESLLDSLHTIFKYNGDETGLTDHLEEYFDAPSHALFVVYIVTNPVNRPDGEKASIARNGQMVVKALQSHTELFTGADLSNTLALALMRASLYMGDAGAALTYSTKIAPGSKAADSPEYNWVVAVCHYLQKEYSLAEKPLLKVIGSTDATPRETRAAARGLIGVYQKLGRPVDALRAAFLYESAGSEDSAVPYEINLFASSHDWEWLLDTPYLLDIQLTDEELREYLSRYGKEAKQIKYPSFQDRNRTAYEAVRYALAVRLARHEKYDESARIYGEILAKPRAARMRTLLGLYEKTTDPSLTGPNRMEARYRYASFLEAHSTQVFFNDMIWYGHQDWTFIGDGFLSTARGLAPREIERFQKLERRVKDEQEERWRAYLILAPIVETGGLKDLRKRAAIKAIRCLDRIAVQRFGRGDEIDRARDRLLQWLRDHGYLRRTEGETSGKNKITKVTWMTR